MHDLFSSEWKIYYKLKLKLITSNLLRMTKKQTIFKHFASNKFRHAWYILIRCHIRDPIIKACEKKSFYFIHFHLNDLDSCTL